MDRRTFLKAGGAGLGGLWLAGSGCTPPPDFVPPANGTPFTSGVLSGLHSPTEVVLWTRLDPTVVPGAGAIGWEVAADPEMKAVVRRGSVGVGPASDHTAKVLVDGLDPDRSWWYRFVVDGRPSTVGRARTLPEPGTDPARLHLAFGSCQEWSSGWYHAWRSIAAEDLDAVVWLGDYIYESGGWTPGIDVRRDPVGEAEDLAGYRAKYRLYRSDPHLQAGHAAHPFVPVWDDHEFKNNCTAADLVRDAARASAAYQAWFEYMPVWPVDGTRIHRGHRWGRLADLSMLDTRQYRDDQANGYQGDDVRPLIGVGDVIREATAEGRTILGAAQRTWLLDRLDAAQADDVTWKLIGNQVMITPIRPVDLDEDFFRALDPNLPRHNGLFVNLDDWSSYQWERELLLGHLADQRISDVAFLTGDIHMFWQSTVTPDFDDPRSPKVANEFVGGGVSSPGINIVGNDELSRAVEDLATTWSPGFRYCDFRRNGYGVVRATAEGMQVAYRATRVRQLDAPVVTSVTFDLTPGEVEPRLTRLDP